MSNNENVKTEARRVVTANCTTYLTLQKLDHGLFRTVAQI